MYLGSMSFRRCVCCLAPVLMTRLLPGSIAEACAQDIPHLRHRFYLLPHTQVKLDSTVYASGKRYLDEDSYWLFYHVHARGEDKAHMEIEYKCYWLFGRAAKRFRYDGDGEIRYVTKYRKNSPTGALKSKEFGYPQVMRIYARHRDRGKIREVTVTRFKMGYHLTKSGSWLERMLGRPTKRHYGPH